MTAGSSAAQPGVRGKTNIAQQVTAAVPVQQVGADSCQPADQVELAQRGQLPAVDALAGLVEAMAGEGGDVAVEGVEGVGVGGLPGGVQGEGDSENTSVRLHAPGRAGTGLRAIAAPHWWAVSHVPVPVRAYSMCSSAMPGAPSAREWLHPGAGS